MTPPSTNPSGARVVRRAIAACRGVVAGARSGTSLDRIVLYPTWQVIKVPGLRQRIIELNSKRIDCWTCESTACESGIPPEAFVIGFIGNTSRAERRAPRIAEDWAGHPIEILSFNYPGYGGSEGPARLADIGPTALAVYDDVRRIAGDRPVFLDGHSLGTAVALHVAANRPVAGCVLRNPPPLRELILGRFGWWNLWTASSLIARKIPRELDSLSNAKAVTVPALFISAEADGVVPARYQRQVVEAYAGPKRVVHLPGAKHNDRATGEAAVSQQQGLEWLWNSAIRD